MNILSTNLYNQNIYTPTFGAKKELGKSKISLPEAPVSDTFERITQQDSLLSKKLELTESEARFNEILLEYYRLERNARTQKVDLYYYYSAQDKYDYQELLKEKRRVKNKLDRMAKHFGTNFDSLEFEIAVKKEYNRFAPKIFRAQSVQELLQWKEDIDTSLLYTKVKALLNELINQQLKIIKK